MQSYHVFPVGSDSNERVAKFLGGQEEPDFHTDCYVGKTRIVLPTYRMDGTRYKSLQNSRDVAFYAFVAKDGGRKQYFQSKGLSRIAKRSLTAIETKIEALLGRLKEKTPA